MSAAINSIVNGFVSLKDRNALEEMREHRQRLLKQLQAQQTGWVDASSTIALFEEDLRAIEAGLTSL
jgi:exonuclease I